MNYGEIIKHSWAITKRYRYLWWLGLLSLWAEGSSGGFGGYYGGGSGYTPSTDTNTTSDIKTSIMDKAHGFPRVLGASDDKASDFFSNILGWMGDHWLTNMIVMATLALLYIIIMYIAESARAGLILSVNQIEKTGTGIGFKSSYHRGRSFAWRLFGQAIIVSLIMLAVLIVIAIIALLPYIITRNTGALAFSIIFGLAALLVFMLLGIYMNLLLRLSSRELVLNDITIMQSLQRGKKLLHLQFGKTILVWLIEVGMAMAISIILILGILIVAGVVFGFGYLISLASIIGAIIFGVLAVLLFAVVMIVFSAIFNSYFSTYWTLSYRAISYIAAQHAK